MDAETYMRMAERITIEGIRERVAAGEGFDWRTVGLHECSHEGDVVAFVEKNSTDWGFRLLEGRDMAIGLSPRQMSDKGMFFGTPLVFRRFFVTAKEEPNPHPQSLPKCPYLLAVQAHRVTGKGMRWAPLEDTEPLRVGDVSCEICEGTKHVANIAAGYPRLGMPAGYVSGEIYGGRLRFFRQVPVETILACSDESGETEWRTLPPSPLDYETLFDTLFSEDVKEYWLEPLGLSVLLRYIDSSGSWDIPLKSVRMLPTIPHSGKQSHRRRPQPKPPEKVPDESTPRFVPVLCWDGDERPQKPTSGFLLQPRLTGQRFRFEVLHSGESGSSSVIRRWDHCVLAEEGGSDDA